MPQFRQDHIHLRSRDPEATARYYHDMFDGKIVESIQTDGRPRVDVDIDGLTICIAQAQPGHDTAPDRPYIGLDHFGLQVEDLDEAARLKSAARVFLGTGLAPPRPRSPSCAPPDVPDEILERTNGGRSYLDFACPELSKGSGQTEMRGSGTVRPERSVAKSKDLPYFSRYSAPSMGSSVPSPFSTARW